MAGYPDCWAAKIPPGILGWYCRRMGMVNDVLDTQESTLTMTFEAGGPVSVMTCE